MGFTDVFEPVASEAIAVPAPAPSGDVSGATDTAVLNAYTAALNAAGGGVLDFSEQGNATYIVAQGGVQLYSGVTLRLGNCTIQLAANPGGTQNPVVVHVNNGAVKWSIQGGIIDGNESNYTSTNGGSTDGAITLGINTVGGSILGTEVKNAKKSGIKCSDAFGGQTTSRLWIDRVYVHDCGQSVNGASTGIYLTCLRRAWITNSVVFNTEDDNIALISNHQDANDFCQDVEVADNVFDTVSNHGANMSLAGVRIDAHDNICLSSDAAVVTNTGNGAVRLYRSDADATNTAPVDCTVHHNTIVSAGVAGFHVDAARSSVSDNEVFGTVNGDGIFVGSTTGGTYPASAGTLEIARNKIVNPALTGINLSPSGTTIPTLDCTDNEIHGSGAQGIVVTTTAATGITYLDLSRNLIDTPASTFDCIRFSTLTITDVRILDNVCEGAAGGGVDINIAGGTYTRMYGRHRIVVGYTNAINAGQWDLVGAGNPAATLGAGSGSLFRRTDGANGTTLYFLEAGGSAWKHTGSLRVVTKTGTYTATADDDLILGDATSGGFTVTLPTAVGITGRIYRVKRVSASNTVTIGTTSSQTIDGATTQALANQWDALAVVSDGTNWQIIADRPSVLGL